MSFVQAKWSGDEEEAPYPVDGDISRSLVGQPP